MNLDSTENVFGQGNLYLSGYGRRWGESLTYSAGTGYSSGLLLGGGYGLWKGIRKGGSTRKLFANSLLNSCAIYAPPLANRCGIIAMFYCILTNVTGFFKPSYFLDPFILGGLSGALYKVSGSWREKGVYGITASIIFPCLDSALRYNWI